MAIIELGPTVVGIRGTVGGLKFSANGSGNYVSNWAKGTNPKTDFQATQRNQFAKFASAWRSITALQKTIWATYAAAPAQDLQNSLGITYSASGFNWFVRINLHLEAVGAAQRDDAPTLTRPLAPIIENWKPRVTTSATDSLVRYKATDPDLTAFHTVFVKMFNSEGREVAADNFTRITIQVPNASRIINLPTQLEERFGTLIDGMRAFLESQIQDAHGQRGPTDVEVADMLP